MEISIVVKSQQPLVAQTVKEVLPVLVVPVGLKARRVLRALLGLKERLDLKVKLALRDLKER